jgi:hypothetical protein
MSSLSERAKVGRKTPNDGKLEISARMGQRLLEDGASIEVVLNGKRSSGHLEAMPCGCEKGGPGHVHFFIQCELLRELAEGTELMIDARPVGRVVRIVSGVREDI